MRTHFATGIATLDEATGIGGIPCGRVTEIYGPPAAAPGLAEITTRYIATAQASGAVVAWIGAEALDLASLREAGVDTARLLVAQPDTFRQASEIIETLVRSGAVDVVIVDGLAVLPCDGVDEYSRARAEGVLLRRVTAQANRGNVSVVFVNPLGDGPSFAPSQSGTSFRFYASMRLEVRSLGFPRVRVKVVKNKVAAPFGTAEFTTSEWSPSVAQADGG